METGRGDATAWVLAQPATRFEVSALGSSVREACDEDDAEKEVNERACKVAVAPAVAAAEGGKEDIGIGPAGVVGKLVADTVVAGKLVVDTEASAEVETGTGVADTEVVPGIEEGGQHRRNRGELLHQSGVSRARRRRDEGETSRNPCCVFRREYYKEE